MQCIYDIKEGEWHTICRHARGRIVAVADLFTYLRYVTLVCGHVGVVFANAH
jgi:hypothetical protein